MLYENIRGRGVLVFNNHPMLLWPVAIVLIGGSICLLVIVSKAFSGEVFSGDVPLVVLLLAPILCLVLLAGWFVMLTRVEKLRIDFTQHIYQLRTGSLWDPIVTGSLKDISYLHLGVRHECSRHGSHSYMYVMLIWNDGKGFQLKAVSLRYRSYPAWVTKRKLETYAARLAARLQVRVIDAVRALNAQEDRAP